MKKFYPLLAFLLTISVAALYGLNHYREVREQQRQETAQLLASCVNHGLLSLFRLQANDWRKRPQFYREERDRLNEMVAQLPHRLLSGDPYPEWRVAADLCGRLTAHSNRRHETIFRPLGQFADPAMSDSRTFKSRDALRQRLRVIDRLEIAARATDRYLQNLRADIESALADSDLSPESRAKVLREINTQVLDYYRKGHFSTQQVDAHLQRLRRYFHLLADNARGFSLRGGALLFHDDSLRREVDNLNSAILQGDGRLFDNWKQVMQRQQFQGGAAR